MKWPWQRGKHDEELSEEIRAHLEMAAREREERGGSAGEARAAARREFGNVGLVKETTRDMWGWAWLERLWQDVRYGLRMMRRSPGFTAVAVLTLALGIGATTAIFSLLDTVILKTLPVANPEQLVLFSGNPSGGSHSGDLPRGAWYRFSYHNYLFFRDHDDSFTDLAAFDTSRYALKIQTPGSSAGAHAEFGHGKVVSGNYFSVLGVKPAAGRMLSPDDDRPRAPAVAVMSYAYWHQRYSDDPSVVGRVIEVNDAPITVVGVAGPDFFGESTQSEDFWFPLVAQPRINRQANRFEDRGVYWLNFVGRLRPGVTLEKAQAAVNVQLLQMLQTDAGSHPSDSDKRALSDMHIELAPGDRGLSILRTEYSQPLHILMAIAGLVFLIVCANVANLLLSRGAAREREVAVRLTVGASRGRLVRQFLTESVLLSVLGGAIGVVLARWCAKTLFLIVAGSGYPVQFSENTRVLCFAVLISMAAGFLFGLAPAIGASRQDFAMAMKGDNRARRKSLFGLGGANTFVILQIAAAVPLLVGTGLLARTLQKLTSEDLGYHEDHVLLTYIDTYTAGYTPKQLPALYQSLLARISALPGVRAVSFGSEEPFGGSTHTSNISFEGLASPSAGTPSEMMAHIDDSVGPNYFETLGIPILRGRDISSDDIEEGRRVAVINETLARKYLPGADPVGMKYCTDDPCPADQAYEIVGVAADARYYSLRDAVPPIAFNANPPADAHISRARYIVIRATGDPRVIEAEAPKIIAATADQLPTASVVPLHDQVLGSLRQDRIVTGLVGAFGGLGLLVACIGLYGTMAYRVARRTREIGIRMALGAQQSNVLRDVIKESSILFGTGLLIGILLAVSMTWIIASRLFGVSSMDPVTMALAAGCLTVVAGIATAIPARRATRVDPMVALRYE